MNTNKLIDSFQTSRKSKDLAIVEGVQALKHAVRFGADIEHLITCDISLLQKFINELAPDISHTVLELVEEVDKSTFAKLSPQPPRTKVIALAKRKVYTPKSINTKKPIVYLEDPRDLENIGAVIRVCAATDVGAVVISGPVDIWHPAVIRGAAGLHFAIPVMNESLAKVSGDRPLLALDPTGELASRGKLPTRAVLIFGTERHGISKQLLQKADVVIRLPMRKGVSSLNLATSVAATLYSM